MRQTPSEQHDREYDQPPNSSGKEYAVMPMQQVVIDELDTGQREGQQPQDQQHAKGLVPATAEFSRIVKIETMREQQHECSHRDNLDVTALDEEFVIEAQRKAAV